MLTMLRYQNAFGFLGDLESGNLIDFDRIFILGIQFSCFLMVTFTFLKLLLLSKTAFLNFQSYVEVPCLISKEDSYLKLSYFHLQCNNVSDFLNQLNTLLIPLTICFIGLFSHCLIRPTVFINSQLRWFFSTFYPLGNSKRLMIYISKRM